MVVTPMAEFVQEHEQVLKNTHLWLRPLLSRVQRFLRCEMIAVCLTLSIAEHNHLNMQGHTADVQSHNELDCDICCHRMPVRSHAVVGTRA